MRITPLPFPIGILCENYTEVNQSSLVIVPCPQSVRNEPVEPRERKPAYPPFNMLRAG